MKKLVILLLFLLMIQPVLGAQETMIADSKDKDKGPIIIDEGHGVKKAVFIHYAKKDPVDPLEDSTDTCYAFLATPAPKWQSTPVSYVINPKNPQGLTTTFIGDAISTSAEEWDDATVDELFKNQYILDTRARFGKYDGKNVLAFGNYRGKGVIAVTYIWFISGQILEFDILFDTDFQWGDATINYAKMDLQNIATHEIGHGVGLADLYTDTCDQVTMYGYSQEGETMKRTLEDADKIGLTTLYGS